MKTISVGSDFSGVGAFDFAIGRVANAKGFKVKNVFACDMDKFARQTYIHNHGEPDYYPTNVYNRDIPTESIDVYMTSPPCQAFSISGKRKGKEDKRGILFFNSHEFIQKNNPRFFIFENVKGLLSDDNGKTFSEWINLLSGKSVNGLPMLFPYENAVNYHVYYDILNAKEHGVPQNRERVFIIGIRDDQDNNFRFPIQEHLTKRLVDILENDVDKKYFLSDSLLNSIIKYSDEIKQSINQNVSTGIDASYYKGFGVRQGKCRQVVKVKSATSCGYELAELGDSINFSNTESKTRRGRVGKQVAQTLDTNCQQGVYMDKIRRLTPRECFRLMDFPDTFTWPVSDSQAYKQAGNSIVVRVLEKIITNLHL